MAGKVIGSPTELPLKCHKPKQTAPGIHHEPPSEANVHNSDSTIPSDPAPLRLAMTILQVTSVDSLQKIMATCIITPACKQADPTHSKKVASVGDMQMHLGTTTRPLYDNKNIGRSAGLEDLEICKVLCKTLIAQEQPSRKTGL